jgi:hypothetical protein
MDSFSDEKREIKKGPLADELNAHPHLEADQLEEKPLEQKDPEAGYSTDPAQGDAEMSLPLADEDKDRYQDDPAAEADNLKESYEMAEESGKNDPGQTDQ